MKSVKRLIQATLRPLGYELIRTGTIPRTPYGLDHFFGLLKRFGFAPRHIVDIGANKGIWTRTAIEYFPDAHYTLVEPQDHLKIHVQDLLDRGYKIHWLNAGAGDKPGSLPLTISYRDDSSSFVPTEQQAGEQGFQRIVVEVKTLNEIVASSSAPHPDMVKIDAEGFDLKVLAGAITLFGKTDIFLVEGVVCATDYENTVAQVIQRMASAGYRLIDITDLNRSPKYGLLWLCELAFLRNECRLFEGVSYE